MGVEQWGTSVYSARLRNQALYPFINPPVSFSSPSPKGEPSQCYVFDGDGVCEEFERGSSVQDCGYFTPLGYTDQWASTAAASHQDPNHCPAHAATGEPSLTKVWSTNHRAHKRLPDDNKLPAEAIVEILNSGPTILAAGCIYKTTWKDVLFWFWVVQLAWNCDHSPAQKRGWIKVSKLFRSQWLAWLNCKPVMSQVIVC